MEYRAIEPCDKSLSDLLLVSDRDALVQDIYGLAWSEHRSRWELELMCVYFLASSDWLVQRASLMTLELVLRRFTCCSVPILEIATMLTNSPNAYVAEAAKELLEVAKVFTAREEEI